MNEERAKRKLTAILSADVKGYTRLMGEDELATIKTLKKYRELISSLIDQFRGRVIDSPGDNLLAEFGSAVDAVECAVKIQEELKKKNDELPDGRRMAFRIGVNLGDVVEDGASIYGEGVNIAARLESLAEPGGICISGIVYNQVKNRLKHEYDSLGEKSLKNIEEAVPVYRVLSFSSTEKIGVSKARIERMAYPLPDKPSIAVLPFDNMSGDPEQDYIGDGLSENIISSLSISSKIFVIARNSTFTYKGKAVKVQQVAEDLGVQYVLEGSIQKSGDRLRVTAQLIDALSGHHLWSEKYDRKMEDLFDLQDEITKKIVVELQVELTEGEYMRVFAKSTDNLEAWNYYIKGLDLFGKINEEDNAKAREHFKAAIELDPEFVAAFAHQAATHRLDSISGWSESSSNSYKRAVELVQIALKIDEQDAFAHAVLGRIYLYQKQYEKAITKGKRAITLNPNLGLGHAILADTMFHSGRFDEAITLMKKAYRLDPNHPPIWLTLLSRIYVHLGRYEEALEVCNQMEEHASKGSIPVWIALLEISFVYQELGREKEARAYMAEALKANHNLSLEHFKRALPFKNPTHQQRALDAYRKAGMPERPPGSVQEKPSIAVLPFINMSNEPEQEYFSDGMAEELIGALAKLKGLKVISRTSAFYFKGKDVNLRTIGEKLKVKNVLEGSVRKAGNKLRISAQLIKVDDDAHLWAETYDRELKDVFAIQDEISQAVVRNLKVKLLGTKAEPLVKDYTKNTEAYELYLKGVFYSNRSMSEKAIDLMERAIKADPNFVPAYAYLAFIHNIMTMGGSLPPWEMKLKVNTLIQKALEIDDKYAFTYVPVGQNKLFEYDWQGAEKSAKRALELNPGHSDSYNCYSYYLAAVGHMDEAILEAKRAVELDPLSSVHRAMLGWWLVYTGQFDPAIELSQETLELDPNNSWVLNYLVMAYAGKGMYDKAISIIQGLKNTPYFIARLGYLYGKVGKRDEAQKILDDFLDRSKKGYFSPYLIARIYSGLGEKEKAFEWLDDAYEVQDPNQYIIKVDITFHSLHSDPRWAEQMKKRGLAD